MEALERQMTSHQWKKYGFLGVISIQAVAPILIAGLLGVYTLTNLVLLCAIHSCLAGWLLYGQYRIHCQEQALQAYVPLNLHKAKHQFVFEFIQSLSRAMGLQEAPKLVIKKRTKDLPELLAESTMLPNYTIIINEDLLTIHGKGLDDEQLKLILAHEFGHLVYKDQLRQWLLNGLQCLFIMQCLTIIVPSLFLLSSIPFLFLTGLLVLTGFTQLAMLRKHARFCELEADRFAATVCDNPCKMLQIFDELPKLYHYWGMLYLEDGFEQPRLYSNFQIAPLLEKLHHYKTSLHLAPDSSKIREIVSQLNSCYPLNTIQKLPSNMTSKSNFYYKCAGIFNAYPSREQRMMSLIGMCKQTDNDRLLKSGKYGQI